MKLKELLPYVTDTVCIYKGVPDAKINEAEYLEYENLYQGKLSGAPEELLNSDLVVLGAQKKDVLDIQIRQKYSLKKERK